MARPKKDEKKVQYTVMLKPSTIKEIEKLAKSARLPTGTFARNLLLTGLDDARLFYKAGLLSLFGTGRKKFEEIKKKLNLYHDEDEEQ